ncbi:MAG: DUF4258 domain-containing protein [Candidatus Diapherotrites archaeon]|nr:DUF4258 domain-containing protein [Candidatus Diapherotrites archaeon]
MDVIWTQHARERFTERALIHNLSRIELEQIIKKQQVRISYGIDKKYNKEKFETVGEVNKKFFTVQKAEDSKKIIVITLWESNQKEVNLWLSKQK